MVGIVIQSKKLSMCDAPPPKRAQAIVSFRPPFPKGGGVLGQRPEPLSAESGISCTQVLGRGKGAKRLGGTLFQKGAPPLS